MKFIEIINNKKLTLISIFLFLYVMINLFEGERGLISNNKCVPYASSYIEGVQKLNL